MFLGWIVELSDDMIFMFQQFKLQRIFPLNDHNLQQTFVDTSSLFSIWQPTKIEHYQAISLTTWKAIKNI